MMKWWYMFRECDYIENFSEIDKKMWLTMESFKKKHGDCYQTNKVLDKLDELHSKVRPINFDCEVMDRNLLNTDSLNLLYSIISVSNNLSLKDSIVSRLDFDSKPLWYKSLTKYVNLKMNQVFRYSFCIDPENNYYFSKVCIEDLTDDIIDYIIKYKKIFTDDMCFSPQYRLDDGITKDDIYFYRYKKLYSNAIFNDIFYNINNELGEIICDSCDVKVDYNNDEIVYYSNEFDVDYCSKCLSENSVSLLNNSHFSQTGSTRNMFYNCLICENLRVYNNGDFYLCETCYNKNINYYEYILNNYNKKKSKHFLTRHE